MEKKKLRGLRTRGVTLAQLMIVVTIVMVAVAAAFPHGMKILANRHIQADENLLDTAEAECRDAYYHGAETDWIGNDGKVAQGADDLDWTNVDCNIQFYGAYALYLYDEELGEAVGCAYAGNGSFITDRPIKSCSNLKYSIPGMETISSARYAVPFVMIQLSSYDKGAKVVTGFIYTNSMQKSGIEGSKFDISTMNFDPYQKAS